jgi:hypothetical protein
MDFTRLFHVLVLGGSVIACDGGTRSSSLTAGDADGTDSTAVAETPNSVDADLPDTSVGGPTEAASPEASAAGPCFCSPTRCCDQHDGSPATVQQGFVCCWGTSC